MATTINNLANITYKYGTSTDSAVSNVATTLLAENYSMSAIKSSLNTNFRPGENLTYTLSLTNDGAEPLFGVSIQDNLGNGFLGYIAGSAKLLRNDTLINITPTSTAPLTLEVPDTLLPGETVLFTYLAKVNSDIDSSITEIVNEVTAIGHEVSVSGPTITVTPNPSIAIPRADYAEVTIAKSVDKTNINVGEPLTYTFRLENSGNMDATDIVIEDQLPANFTVTSITSETGGVQTVFEVTDYSVDATNKLILPTSTTKTILVPARTITGNGITIVTIVGTITD